MSDSAAALAHSNHLRFYHAFQDATLNASNFVTATTVAFPNELTTSGSGGEGNSLAPNIVESAAKTEDEQGQELISTCSIRLSREEQSIPHQMMALFPSHFTSLSHTHSNLHFRPCHSEPISPTSHALYMSSPIMVESPSQPLFHYSCFDPSIPSGQHKRTETPSKFRAQYGMFNFRTKPEMFGDYETWSLEERQYSRRIVGFSKSPMRDTIHIRCFPVAPTDYRPNMVTISCVYCIPHDLNENNMEKKKPNDSADRYHQILGKCIFTSVDIIILLERIVDTSFDVQEKNRIRRNLEGYHPVTIKKEGDTLPFFNQLMSYQEPKTRNIEKDIKVFKWEYITKAMKTIFTKYTASKRNRSRGYTQLAATKAVASSIPRPMMSTVHYGGQAQLSSRNQSSISDSQSLILPGSPDLSLLTCSSQEPSQEVGDLGIVGFSEIFEGSLVSSDAMDGYIPEAAVFGNFNQPSS